MDFLIATPLKKKIREQAKTKKNKKQEKKYFFSHIEQRQKRE